MPKFTAPSRRLLAAEDRGYPTSRAARKSRRFSATALAAASLVLMLGSMDVARAQSNTTGTVFGTVQPAAGLSVLVENPSTGFKRTVAVDGSGKFSAASLPTGTYRASLLKDGKVIGTSALFDVLIGQGSEVAFSSTDGPQSVVVTGSRIKSIDVTSTNNGAVFTSRQLAALPIAQNLTSIILLSPDSVAADSRYAGGASIGGGAPSENSYYINGFPVTNALSQLGSIELPFGAIQQAQVLTGGFGAEFGRSVGGVVNVTTKSGTNTWEAGGSATIEPNSLRSKSRSIYYPNTGASVNAKTDGTINLYKGSDTKSEWTLGGYVGGPIIQDKLFIFAAVDTTRTNSGFVNQGISSSLVGTSGWIDEADHKDRYLAKVDWNITDNHRIEWTSLGDNSYTQTKNYAFDYSTLTHGSTLNYTANYENFPNVTPAVGGSANILKYTGNLTQDLTLTALIGKNTTRHQQTFSPDLAGGFPGITWTATGRAPGLTYFNPQPLAGSDLSPAYAYDETKSGRFDLEYVLGKHTIRAGLDEVRLSSRNAGEVEAGGSTWRYSQTANPNALISAGPYKFKTNDGSVLGAQGYYVRQHIFSDVTDARSDQSAQYIEDRWQTLKDLVVTLGLRNEGFKGINGDGQTYLESKNFVSPRVGAAWDVKGDSSLKVFGNLGRYSVQTPTHLAVRGASRSTLTYQYFTYTGIDPVTGAPTGLNKLTPAPYSPDGETGQAKDAKTISAQNIKPTYQDEIAFGFEQALTPKLTFGAKLTYRQLKATLDDFCDGRPFENFAAAHNIDTSNWQSDGACIDINPGVANSFLVDYSGVGKYTQVNLSAADIGLPKAKRTFLAIDAFLEHPLSDGWYGKVTYTWSKNKGNTEGQTKSDIGQTDVSATETWDFPQIMEGAYGYLPSDRTHQIKAYGYVQATPEWGFGAKFTAASGRPKNCFGNYGGADPEGDPGYGSAFFYCQFDPKVGPVPTPRGSQGRLPWDIALDANAVYAVPQVKGLSVRVDVFNLFNRQSAQNINEIHEADGDPNTILSTYGQVISYSAPRAVKFTLQYGF